MCKAKRNTLMEVELDVFCLLAPTRYAVAVGIVTPPLPKDEGMVENHEALEAGQLQQGLDQRS